MAAGAAVAPREDFLALMVRMGGSREKGFDPFPPDQYTCFTDPDLQLSPRGHQALAWLRMHCLRPKRCLRTEFAADERKQPLRLKDLGAYYGWDAGATSRVWKELEREDLAHKCDKDILWLHATVNPKRTDKSTAATDPNRTDKLPGYVLEQIREYPEDQRQRAILSWNIVDELEKDAIASVVHSVRDAFADRRAEIMAREGVTIRRHASTLQEEKRAERRAVVNLPQMSVQDFEARVEEKLVQTTPEPAENCVQTTPELPESAELDPVQNSVQTTDEPARRSELVPVQNRVQTTQTRPYTVENQAVQVPYPYICKDKEDKVSKCAAGAAETRPDDDLPTSKPPEPTPTPKQTDRTAEPLTVAGIAARKTLSVDKKKSTPETHPVLRTVEMFFGDQIKTPALRREYLNLAVEKGIPQEAMARCVFQKMEESISKGKPVYNAGALLQFVRKDADGWIAQNGTYIA